MSELMSNVDNFWLCMDDPTNLMLINGFLRFDEVIDYEKLKANLENRLLCFERFKQKAVKPISGVGVPTWELDEHFDIRSHVHRIALPAPGNKKVLQELLSDLVSIPLDETKPLWQCYLIENYGEGCVLFFKVHHCIADGIALVYVVLSTMDLTQDAQAPEIEKKNKEDYPFLTKLPIVRAAKKAKRTLDNAQKLGQKFLEEIANSISSPSHFAEQVKTYAGLATDAATVITRLALLPPHPKNSFKGKLGVRKKVAWTKPIALGNIKTITKVVEATLNDVLIATVTGALRRYLTIRNDRVNELDLQVAVPVNIRKPGTEFELGNKFSLVFLALPVHIEDPVLRLREVKRRMDELKKSPDAFVGFQVLNALGLSPATIAKKAAQLFANKATGVLTNVPGPRQPLYFVGKKITNMMFWVPRIGDIGIGISIFSYDGKVSVGISSDEKLVPNPEDILEGFEEDFNFLLDLVKSGKIFDEPLVINDRYKEAQLALQNKDVTEDNK